LDGSVRVFDLEAKTVGVDS
jgi:hypothetical protein